MEIAQAEPIVLFESAFVEANSPNSDPIHPIQFVASHLPSSLGQGELKKTSRPEQCDSGLHHTQVCNVGS